MPKSADYMLKSACGYGPLGNPFSFFNVKHYEGYMRESIELFNKRFEEYSLNENVS